MIIISCLQECLLCAVMVDKIRGPPSQCRSDFQYFLSHFEQLLINIEGFNPNVTVLLGEYNQDHDCLVTLAHLNVSNLMS